MPKFRSIETKITTTHTIPNTINTNSANAVMSNWDRASANDVPPMVSGEPGMILGVGIGVGMGVGLGVGDWVGEGVAVGVGTQVLFVGIGR